VDLSPDTRSRFSNLAMLSAESWIINLYLYMAPCNSQFWFFNCAV